MGNFAKIQIAAGLATTFALILLIDTSKMVFEGYLLPRMLGVIIILLALGMVYETWWCGKKTTSLDCEVSVPINKKNALVFVGLTVAYILGINYIGYFIATPAFILIAFRFLKSMNNRNTALVAAGFTIFVYLVFVSFLQLPIPLGPME